MPIDHPSKFEQGLICPICGGSTCEHSKEYSKEFLDLLKQEGVPNLLQGSSYEGSFKSWENHRKFIVGALVKDGTILDVGCGNGFFLRCLQEWSGKQLDPYGIDTNERFIQQVADVFPEKSGHFVLAQTKAPENFPQAFDTVFWCVWDGLSFESARGQEYLQKIQSRVLPGGRLILGFYNSTRTEIEPKLEYLRTRFPNLEVRYAAGENVPEALAFVDL